MSAADAALHNRPVTMPTYKALIFDLFNTVALWDPARMPRLRINGEERLTTLGELGRCLAERVPELRFGDFHAALELTNIDLVRERRENMREIPSRERFRRALTRAGHGDHADLDDSATALSLTHMEVLKNASAIPAVHVDMLQRFRNAHRVALLSNFDHAPTARAILERDGAEDCFESVVISDEHGYRKPHPQIFADTLAALDATPEETLFIGDSVEDDVVGAKGAGLAVAWVNPKQKALPEDAPAPDHVVADITELEALLGSRMGA